MSVSLENLNSGCTMTVGVVRHRVDDHGIVVECPKNFHLILRKVQFPMRVLTSHENCIRVQRTVPRFRLSEKETKI